MLTRSDVFREGEYHKPDLQPARKLTMEEVEQIHRWCFFNPDIVPSSFAVRCLCMTITGRDYGRDGTESLLGK